MNLRVILTGHIHVFAFMLTRHMHVFESLCYQVIICIREFMLTGYIYMYLRVYVNRSNI